MKKLILLGLVIITAWGCSSPKNIENTQNPKKAIIIDSTEYVITIDDPDFDTWYLLRYSASQDHSNEFYQMKNNYAVTNWNDYLVRNKYSRVINYYINYNPSTDYGIEVNRKLYWYFKYIEENYRVSLLR